jgi:transketolase N-terminal domain/subunit
VEMGDIAAKLAAFGWGAVTVDGRDRDALRAAYGRRTDGPTAIVAVVL